VARDTDALAVEPHAQHSAAFGVNHRNENVPPPDARKRTGGERIDDRDGKCHPGMVPSPPRPGLELSRGRSIARVEPLGPKLAEGRDSEIFEHGPGRVLRRARDGRSLVAEADIMRHVREHGYPAPEVFDAGEGWLVMERLEGKDMLAAMSRSLRGIKATGMVLADLHHQLAKIPAPEWLRAGPGADGDRVVHLDLHPLNVMATPDGPRVIDWANARKGDPATDVANTWSLIACADPPGGLFDKIVTKLGRGIFLNAFLKECDEDAARKAMPAVVEWRVQDRNHTDSERARIRKLAQ